MAEKHKRKPKKVRLYGKRQRMQTCCPQCGAKKIIEYRAANGSQWIYGATKAVDIPAP